MNSNTISAHCSICGFYCKVELKKRFPYFWFALRRRRCALSRTPYLPTPSTNPHTHTSLLCTHPQNHQPYNHRHTCFCTPPTRQYRLTPICDHRRAFAWFALRGHIDSASIFQSPSRFDTNSQRKLWFQNAIHQLLNQ